jgi:acetyl-CoA C-acetyltransferase
MRDERVPVIVGVGQVRGNRERTVEGAREPFALLLDAVRAADLDARSAGVAAEADHVAVVRMATWAYDGAAARVGRALGANPRTCVDTPVGGHWPAQLLEDAAAAIAAGESRVALVAGAEAMASLGALHRAGIDPAAHGWSAEPGGPPTFDPDEVGSPAMQAAGLVLPTRVYPLFENALAAARGESPEQAARCSAELYAAFSRVAAANPGAWDPRPRGVEEIATPGPGNRMVCDPYPLALNANPHVDQAAAVLVTSLAVARERGLTPVFVHGGAAARDAADVLARPSFARSDALADVLDRALAGVPAPDLIDVYSCFPVVPKLVAAHLGRPLADVAGVTGGHSSFGGPLSSYTLHALVGVTRALRERPGTALVHGNGGYLTHQHALVLGTAEAPYRGDPVPRDTTGPAPDRAGVSDGEVVTIETATVEHGREGAPKQAFLVARTAAGARIAASTEPGDAESAAHLAPAGRVGERVRVRAASEHVVIAAASEQTA